ncbi:MAG: hypothetical protein ACT4SY_08315 [Hyphomicrobiales bacterium]
MIRFVTLTVVAVLILLMAWGGSAGIFGGVALLAACVAGFGLLVALCTELIRQN